jgi:penicillin amidase
MRRAAPLLALAALLGCPSEETSGVPTAATVDSNPSLGASVEVLYDGGGVPHVQAQSDGDAAYALGYLHARDRLFEMDLYRRIARGRLSELAGDVAVPADTFYRTVFTSTQRSSRGTYRIEDVVTDGLSTQMRGILEAYAAGVNRFLADLAGGKNGARLPAQYAIVQTGASDVAPWEIEDTVAIARLQTWNLSSSFTDDIDAFQIFTSGMPAAMFADLTRLAPAVDTFILPGNGLLRAGLAARLAPPVPAVEAGAEALRAFMKAVPRLLPERAASNNWVLSPGKASGNALVANDPHLALYNPANFHLAHLVTPTRDVAGVAFPGTPAFIIGHNDRIAWGLTYVGYDVTDVYAETASGGTIVTPPGARATVTVTETIQVKGGAPVTIHVVLVPAHGPVLPGTLEAGRPLSLKWTGQVDTQDLQAVYDLNAARSVDEAFAAWKNFQVGAQNLVVADTAGKIGYDPHAAVPIRDPACFTAGYVPWMPMPGLAPGPAVGPCEWTGFIADADLPQAKHAPSDGPYFIATANNDINGSTQTGNPIVPGPYLYPTVDLGFRHARIVERLGSKASGYTLDDMTDIQADDFSKLGEAIVPALGAWFASSTCATETTAQSCPKLLDDSGLSAAAALLASWDFTTPTGLTTTDPTSASVTDAAVQQASAAAALFHAFVPRFARRILDDELAGYDVGGAPLAVDRLSGLAAGDQALSKYLVALAGYAPGGTPPALPLLTSTSLCDDVRTAFVVETCADMAVLALGDAVAFLSEASVLGSADPAVWRWGRLHRVVFASPLSQFGATLFDYGPFAHHGGLYTVDVGNFAWDDDGSAGFWSAGGFIQHAGPNVRFSAELADGHVRWRAVIPGGEVDIPGDPHYEDQIPAWLANDKGDQPYTSAEVDAAAKDRMVFTR